MTTHVDVRGLLRSKGRTWLALTWIACCVPAHALGGNRDLEDVNIQGAIEDQLLLDPSVPWNDIDLSAADGIVTLNGTVDNLLAKERAASIARTVKGVRAVVNRIEVDPDPAPADEDVRRNVRAALEADPATRA
ncbi:MAG TPA: BON domain-containing protein, partial [Vicinamibacteria bacterium]|nr:BON domain-containing protein [Vicinamibacteria bacterium]